MFGGHFPGVKQMFRKKKSPDCSRDSNLLKNDTYNLLTHQTFNLMHIGYNLRSFAFVVLISNNESVLLFIYEA